MSSERPSGAVRGPPAVSFEALLRESIADASFVKLVFAKSRQADSDLKRVSVRAIELRGAPALSFVYTHPTRDVTRNASIDDGIAIVLQLLADGFGHAHLATVAENVEVRVSRKGQQTVRRARRPTHAAAATEPAAADDAARPGAPTLDAASSTGMSANAEPATHDRPKHRFVDIERPFLVDLGVTDAAHRLVPALARKWKQINKFVEIFDRAIGAAGLAHASPICVADFGSGKGYLTFAVHDHLVRTLGLDAFTTGVELRADLVELGNRAARRSAMAGLGFVEGDLRTHQPGELDVMIALHACDVATDHAIHLGVRAGARVILCSPCCHQELRPQMTSPAAVAPMLRHGVHLGQQAEMVTDSLRALCLEAAGYDAQVFEFVSLEHTSKNKMILAVRRNEPGAAGASRAAALAEARRIKDFYGIREQRLERLLAF